MPDIFALDRSRPTIIPKPHYQSPAAPMGNGCLPSENDHNMMAVLYFSQMGESAIRTPTEAQRTRFDRGDMLLAMERLHGFYMSRMGLQRPQGLSINGRPDSWASRNGSSISTCRRARRASARKARSTSSSPRSRGPTNGGRRTRDARR